VLNVVNGFGVEAGKPLASSPRIAKIAFTGETTTGRLIMQYASENLIPVTLELGGKSPNIFFADVMAKDDDFLDKALEGFAMFALNQGEVCTCPSRALVQESIAGSSWSGRRAREEDRAGQSARPDDDDRRAGLERAAGEDPLVHRHRQEGGRQGAHRRRARRARRRLAKRLLRAAHGLPGHNKMRIFQEEIFGPVVSMTTFKDFDDAMSIANDTLYGLGAGVWTRDGNTAYRAGRGIQAGRVWTNCYHLYPAHAAFGGYKQSGIGARTTR
jgi:aldehyde dehydrogenase